MNTLDTPSTTEQELVSRIAQAEAQIKSELSKVIIGQDKEDTTHIFYRETFRPLI